MALSLNELNPKIMEDRYDSETAERLMERAGRSEDLNDNELMISIDEAITKARLGHFGRATMQDSTADVTNTSKPKGTDSKPGQETEVPTPYPTQSPEEVEHVINELIMT